MECTLEDILVFLSCASTVPPLGFERQPQLDFLHDPLAILPTASTCDLILRIPTSHSEYEKFQEHMILGLIGNDGFGAV